MLISLLSPLDRPPSLPQDGRLRLVFDNQAERKMLDARHDFDDVSKLTKAEMARFDRDKVDDFKKALEDYADSLAERQREVCGCPITRAFTTRC